MGSRRSPEESPRAAEAPPAAPPLAGGKRYHVHGVGLCAVDYLCRVEHLPARGEKLQVSAISRRAGGQVGTALTALSRWGLRTVYSGKFGDDVEGEFGRAELAAAGVDMAGAITVAGAPSQSAIILVHAGGGERTILWQRAPEVILRPQELQPRLTEAALALMLDGYEVDAAIEAARTARRRGAIVMLDAEEVTGTPRVAELVSLCDLVIGCADFPQRFTGQRQRRAALRRLHASLPSGGLAGCTLGPDGAILFDGERFTASPGFAVNAVDTTGAGDVFHAGFLYATLVMPERGLGFRLDFANACAALSCTAFGAREGIPHLEEALRLVAQRAAAKRC